VVHVASSWRSSGSEAKDSRFHGVGYDAVELRPKYPPLAVISFSAHRGILVFWLDYKSDQRGRWLVATSPTFHFTNP
jgi:hypothetical protein